MNKHIKDKTKVECYSFPPVEPYLTRAPESVHSDEKRVWNLGRSARVKHHYHSRQVIRLIYYILK